MSVVVKREGTGNDVMVARVSRNTAHGWCEVIAGFLGGLSRSVAVAWRGVVDEGREEEVAW